MCRDAGRSATRPENDANCWVQNAFVAPLSHYLHLKSLALRVRYHDGFTFQPVPETGEQDAARKHTSSQLKTSEEQSRLAVRLGALVPTLERVALEHHPVRVLEPESEPGDTATSYLDAKTRRPPLHHPLLLLYCIETISSCTMYNSREGTSRRQE